MDHRSPRASVVELQQLTREKLFRGINYKTVGF
jgi:hypothetical protein